MSAKTAAATAVESPRTPWRKRTVKAMMLIWATQIRPLPTATRHMRGSRSGWTKSPSSSRSSGGASRRPIVPATAVARHAPASTSSPARVPPPAAIGGRHSAAAAPPSGSAVCRIPRANPRWEGANQPMTARPLAAFTLAPAAPATDQQRDERAVARRERGHRRARTLATARPEPSTRRSPSRSVSSPQGSSVTSEPTLTAAITTPDLGEREPVLLAQVRREHRDPEEDGGVARLRDRAEREDRPAVAAHAAEAIRLASPEPLATRLGTMRHTPVRPLSLRSKRVVGLGHRG